MGLRRWVPILAAFIFCAAVVLHAGVTLGWNVLTGDAAWADSHRLLPGMAREITAVSLPAPSASNADDKYYVQRPAGALPVAPPGFTVNIYADTNGVSNPRQIRTAPNGDVFVVNQVQGTVSVYRGIAADGRAVISETFTAGLFYPFGVNFYPLGDDPQWVYVSEPTSVRRYPYRNGDLRARGAPETIVNDLPLSGHSSRDLVFSRDGTSMFVAVGSKSNIDDPDIYDEFHCASILEYTPEGQFVGIYASGIRNPSALTIHPQTGELWVSVNERDHLGDNIAPDFVTHVQKGGFYGWPYYYAGGIRDDRLLGARPELQSQTILPDVLIQAHSASLGLVAYTGTQFPAEYRNDIFAAEHGSWNRSVPSGHEVIRVPLAFGKANGIYQDFLTGFMDADGHPWGKPSGVAVAADGSLLVTDDAAAMIWRVSYVAVPVVPSEPIRRRR